MYIKNLEEIKKCAPEYRQKYLQSRLDVARKRKDEKMEKAIIRILKQEYDNNKFGRLQVAMGNIKVFLRHRLPFHLNMVLIQSFF